MIFREISICVFVLKSTNWLFFLWTEFTKIPKRSCNTAALKNPVAYLFMLEFFFDRHVPTGKISCLEWLWCHPPLGCIFVEAQMFDSGSCAETIQIRDFTNAMVLLRFILGTEPNLELFACTGVILQSSDVWRCESRVRANRIIPMLITGKYPAVPCG